jgi:uncharacterized glyoxalase superfamily protein PhnB
MSQRSGKPTDMPWLSPYLTVKDAGAALDFYARAFGFMTKGAMPGPNGAIQHAAMTYHDAVIMLGPEHAYGGESKAPASTGTCSPVSLCLYSADVDTLFARAREAGATVQLAPEDTFWGDRMCRLTDPDGHIWIFATSGRECAQEQGLGSS